MTYLSFNECCSPAVEELIQGDDVALLEIRKRNDGGLHTTAILVNTEAVMNARVTMGTSKYHASRGSRAAPSIASVWVEPTLSR
jgi:hypothetical protein